MGKTLSGIFVFSFSFLVIVIGLILSILCTSCLSYTVSAPFYSCLTSILKLTFFVGFKDLSFNSSFSFGAKHIFEY